MGFVARRNNIEPYETWPGLKRAASFRYSEALLLLCLGNRSGALYLAGYVAELLLKAAYCEFTRKPPTDNVYLALRQDALTAQQQNRWVGQGRSGAPNLHSLVGLGNLLVDARTQAGYGDPILAGELLRHLLIVQSHWDVELRYASVVPTLGEVVELFRSVHWMRKHYGRLRSR